MQSTTTRLYLVVIALLSLVVPSSAMWGSSLFGRLKLVYEEKGQVSAVIYPRGGTDYINLRGLPLTGDRNAGPAVLKWNGVPVAQWSGPPYEKEFDLSQPSISGLTGESVLPWFKYDPKQRIDLSTLTIGKHCFELFFASIDERGKLDRNRTAAPATQVVIEDLDPPQAATTTSGQPLTPEQLKDAIKQSYEQGSTAGKDAGVKEREQLLAELQKTTDELNALRRNAALGSDRPRSMPLGLRYLPVAWKQEDWPVVSEEMILVDSQGRTVTKAKVVEAVPQLGRIWVSVTIPVDLDLKGHTVRRSKDRKEKNQ